jgi:hypothetical protein
MNFISKIKNILPNKQPKILLGRWKIDYSDPRSAEIINKKIDLSNEDHCGVCNNTTRSVINLFFLR